MKDSASIPTNFPKEKYEIKWCHFSDVHLGYKQYNKYERFKDFGRAFKKVMELSLAENPDFILISGDLFETYRPPPDAIRQAIEVLELARKARVKVYCIPGNHDLSYAKEHRRQGGILGLLDRLGYIVLVKEGTPYYHQRDGKAIAQITGLWYQGSNTIPRLKEVLARHREHYQNTIPIPRILMLHAFLQEMFPSSPDVRLGDLRALPFDYVAMGHHHGYFFDKEGLQVFNPGSTEHRSSNEWDTKDWLRGQDFNDEEDTFEYSMRNYIVARMIVDPENTPPSHIVEKDMTPKQFQVRKKVRYIVKLGKITRDEAINKMKEIIKKIDEPEACIAVKFIGELQEGLPLFNIAELTEKTRSLNFNIDLSNLQPVQLPVFVYQNTKPREIYERTLKARYQMKDQQLVAFHVDLIESVLNSLEERSNEDEIISLIESFIDKASTVSLFSIKQDKNQVEQQKQNPNKVKVVNKKSRKKSASITLDQFKD